MCISAATKYGTEKHVDPVVRTDENTAVIVVVAAVICNDGVKLNDVIRIVCTRPSNGSCCETDNLALILCNTGIFPETTSLGIAHYRNTRLSAGLYLSQRQFESVKVVDPRLSIS